jgi:hypothetical protein
MIKYTLNSKSIYKEKPLIYLEKELQKRSDKLN